MATTATRRKQHASRLHPAQDSGVRELAPALSDSLPRPKSGGKPPHSTWPHAPVHHLTESGVYMVTAGTYRKQPLFREGPAVRMLHDALLAIAAGHGWRLEAWAVFANHYHFIAAAPADPGTLTLLVRELHSRTAIALNRHDAMPDRKVWHNYWDTRLRREASYLARINYVHQNAVKHGVASSATDYPWCSAAWFERTATPARVRAISGFKIDGVRVPDDF